MKKILTILICTLSLALKAQIVHIPDANFKKALIEYGIDINHDGEIQESEALLATKIIVSEDSISSLEGIASFANIIELSCDRNNLTALDVSKNLKLEKLFCDKNKLTSLDVSKNPNLSILDCHKNGLTSLDVSKNANLFGLFCNDNKLTSLDVTSNPELNTLDCKHNKLTKIYITFANNTKGDYTKDATANWVKK